MHKDIKKTFIPTDFLKNNYQHQIWMVCFKRGVYNFGFFHLKVRDEDPLAINSLSIQK